MRWIANRLDRSTTSNGLTPPSNPTVTAATLTVLSLHFMNPGYQM